jgi:predicted PurR-regulated permease PerM
MRQVLKYTGYLALIVLAVFLIYRFYFMAIWVLIAAVISFVGQPIAQFFDNIHVRRLRMPHTISSLLSLIIIVAVFFGLLSLFVPLIINQANTISQIDVVKLTSNLEQPMNNLDLKLHNLGLIPADQTLWTYLVSKTKSLVGISNIGSILGNFISVAGNLFAGLFSILFIAFFFIKDEHMFEEGIMLFVREKHHTATSDVIKDSKLLLKRYFIGLILEVISVMLLIAAGLWVLGVENPLLIGFFGGIMNIIPYLGPVIGSALGITIGITTTLAGGNYHELMPAMLKMVGVFVAVQFIDNNILAPLIYAKSVKSHPLEIFLIIIMGGSLAGLAGMIVAVPVYTVLRVIAREFFRQFRVVQKITETMNNQ